jgi:hypothetical protein
MTENNDKKKNISNHILPTASNLLGLCFVILSYIKLSNLSHQTVVDELVSVLMVFLLASSLFSYVSIRAKTKNDLYEKIADVLFIIALVLLSLTSIVVVYENW